MWSYPKEYADLVKITEKVLNGNLHWCKNLLNKITVQSFSKGNVFN